MFEQSEFVSEAPSWYAEHQGSIYSAACQICLRSTTVWLEEHACHQLVAYFFESGHKFEKEADAFLRHVAQMPTAEGTHRYHSHSFMNKKKAAGLQAADVLAWTIARANVGFQNNRTMAVFEPHVRALSQDSSRYQINIFTREKLRRFFKEQAEKPDAYLFKRMPELRSKLR